ncbi:MAG: arginine--tRNA ligase, partial [Woeseiaceae bacterium]
MKRIVADILTRALDSLGELAEAASELAIESTIERTRDPQHGEFASNIAMRLAKPARKNPREIATQIVAAIGDNDAVSKVDIAGPGFINFYLSPGAFHAELESIIELGDTYGRQAPREGPKIHLEFVSANPTGPLHVGHGRGASYGATVGNLLEAAGYTVHREYYVNDAGRQMDILGASVWLRWLEARGVEVPFPQGGYRGDYIRDIAIEIDTSGMEPPDAGAVTAGLPENTEENADAYVDALVVRCKELHGEDGFDRIRQQALESIR